MTPIEFATPLALLLLAILPLWWLWRRRARPPAIIFSRVAILARGPRAGRGLVRTLVTLRALVLVGLVIALARPRAAGGVEEEVSEGIDIVIAFDISSSMLALDFQPRNRLEVAREAVTRFIAGRRHDRIGLVSFAGEALTQVPLTTDYRVLQSAVSGLQPGQLEDGTAIGSAIATAANRLREGTSPSRVLILFTDGVNNRGMNPRVAARAAAEFGIRIYGVGVGSRGTAMMPVERGPQGLIYAPQRVEIDEALLTEIAAGTGGQYFRATDPQALDRITAEINRLERAPVEVRRRARFTELYPLPLALSLTALLLALALAAWRGPLP